MKYLIVACIAIAAVLLWSCRRRVQHPKMADGPTNRQPKTTMHNLLKEELKGKRMIVATRMAESEVQAAIHDFMELNAEDGAPVDMPVVEENADGTISIHLPDSTTYDLFCYWVNYLVYSNKSKRLNDNITGWFEVPADAQGLWEGFANQRLMFYIPETDTEYDNVFFTTENNVCYKQEFAYGAPLVRQEGNYKRYVDVPQEQ